MANAKKSQRMVPINALVGDLSPEALTEFLRVWDDMRERVLQGFRLHPKSVKSPAVTQRLLRELERDHDVTAALVELWQMENLEFALILSSLTVEEIRRTLPQMVAELGRYKSAMLLALDDRSTVRKLAMEVPTISVPDKAPTPKRKTECETPAKAPEVEAQLSRLQRQNTRLEERTAELQREIAAARSDAQSASRTEEKAKSEVTAIRRELEDAQKALDRAARRAERAEKQRDDLEAERSGLVHELRTLRRAKPSPVVAAEPPAPRRQEDVWPDAVARLVQRKQYEAALAFCGAMSEVAAEDARPRILGVRVARLLKDGQRILDDSRWLSARFIAEKYWAKAAHYACLALAHDPEFTPARDDLKLVLQNTSLRNERQVSELRHVFVRLRASSPEAYKAVAQILKHAGKDYVKALAVQSPGFSLDRQFNLDMRGRTEPFTLRKLLACLNSNREPEVTAAKEGLANLQKSRPELRNEIREALEAVDPSYETVLSGPTSPMVVDGSNVAFMLQTQSGKPRLQNLILVRRALRELRFWPILILCDAALPHQIDRASELGSLVDAGEVMLADPRTDADEQLICRAKERDCPLLTNDQMADWDPDGEAPKLRFNVYDDRAVIFSQSPNNL